MIFLNRLPTKCFALSLGTRLSVFFLCLVMALLIITQVNRARSTSALSSAELSHIATEIYADVCVLEWTYTNKSEELSAINHTGRRQRIAENCDALFGSASMLPIHLRRDFDGGRWNTYQRLQSIIEKQQDNATSESKTSKTERNVESSAPECSFCVSEQAESELTLLEEIDHLRNAIVNEKDQSTASANLVLPLVTLGCFCLISLPAAFVIIPCVRKTKTSEETVVELRKTYERQISELETRLCESKTRQSENSRRATAMLNILGDLQQEKARLREVAIEREKSEKQVRRLLEHAPHAMLAINEEGSISIVNSACEEMFGYEREELLCTPVNELLPQVESALDQLDSTRESDFVEVSAKKRDNTKFYIELRSSPIDLNGEVRRLLSIVDITPHKISQESNAKLAAIVESSQDAIIAVTLNGTVTSWNHGAEKIYGFTQQKMLKSPISKIFPAERRSEIDSLLDAMRSGQQVGQFESVHQRSDSQLIDVCFTASPITCGEGGISGVSVIARDISDAKRSELKLKRYAQDLKDSNQELEQFAYVASHDLKEPLRMVSNYTSLLEEEYADRLDEDAHRYIAYATNGARRMSALIDDLLNYSRVGRMDQPFESIDLNQVFSDVALDLQTSIEDAEATLNVQEGLPVVRGNATRLRQLFINLIANGIKFRDPNRAPHITVFCEELASFWKIDIRDNGVGIDEEFFDRIFQVFQRLHTIDEYEGTGIGLAVCKKIAEQHGGTICLESELHVGTTFSVNIPKTTSRTKHIFSSQTVETTLCRA